MSGHILLAFFRKIYPATVDIYIFNKMEHLNNEYHYFMRSLICLLTNKGHTYEILKTETNESYYLEAAFPKSAAPMLSDGQHFYLYVPPEQMVIITD